MSLPRRIFAAIGVGSNLGDRRANIEAAVGQLALMPQTEVAAMSSLWENAAVGGPASSPPFLNGAAALQTQLGPRELLGELLAIEQRAGRRRTQKWEPRPIDLDLLLYGDAIIQEDDLTVPHPLMHQRRFVLQPLAEIAPDAMHPLLRRTAAELLTDLQP